jgi:hypothetical protein
VSHLAQGHIARAKVFDQQGGNPKVRPRVVVTATSEIPSQDALVAVAITGRFSDPLADDEVILPWHPEGRVRTRLRKSCLAKCSWLCQIRKEDTVATKGTVPRAQMEKIIGILRDL